MHDQPSVRELVQAVKNFVDETAMPELTGRAGFHARVASNVLGTILRDIDTRFEADASEKTRLLDLLEAPADTSLSKLNEDLRQRIRAGELTIRSDDLMRHLKMTAIDQLKVDQPNYSALKKAIEEP
ncbi:hypothetical protein D1227_17770 [Henriciella mobilis]|uniref:DUF6285 domain-containing protein n=1 Tax=Henriciella mobilis TaxID=2305467 RepID=UPI000E66A05F|nr:DUF6285 domain-containing protein [Henriciella mobilis]RIJ15357.1 hypothetical protein D1231_11420 [Henriciella mobilis]RIJ18821.1 hypothetical protein D1227_17770 [Henriciella mobilis]